MENIKDNNYIVPIFVHTEVGGDNASNSIVTLAGNGFYIDDFFIRYMFYELEISCRIACAEKNMQYSGCDVLPA